MGQSWSDPVIGRIKIEVSGELVERWVAFIGGGYDTSGKGRGLFVVDIKTGDIIKDISGYGDAVTASPLVVDTNSDGYVDKIYIGDLGGKMYVANISNKNPNLWTGKVLFVAPGAESGKHPIYYQPSVALDRKGTPWVFFGTGDRENPTENTTERFYAIKDNDLGTYPRRIDDLVDVSTNPANFTPVPDNKYGWTIKLTAANKEKVLAKAVVFNGLVYFTTFSPLESDTNSCTTGGTARLYVAEYLSGGGALEVDDLADLAGSTTGFTRSKVIGSGDPSAPVISLDEHGQATITIGTTETQIISFRAFSPVTNKEVLYWREVIP
jgi:type IV pilus assembly protein PilY1